MPKRFSKEQRQEWKERLLKQKESGLTISKWCRENHVKCDAFYYWKKQFEPALQKKLDRSCFKEISHLPDKSGIVIRSHKLEIHFDKNCGLENIIRDLMELNNAHASGKR